MDFIFDAPELCLFLFAIYRVSSFYTANNTKVLKIQTLPGNVPGEETAFQNFVKAEPRAAVALMTFQLYDLSRLQSNNGSGYIMGNFRVRLSTVISASRWMKTRSVWNIIFLKFFLMKTGREYSVNQICKTRNDNGGFLSVVHKSLLQTDKYFEYFRMMPYVQLYFVRN
jgi:hypothetical protein